MEKQTQQGEEGGEDDPSPLYILSLSSSLSSPSSENMKLSPTSLHTPFENINIENMTKEICLQRGQLLPNQVFCSERSFKLQQLNDTWLFGFLLNSIFTPASRTTAFNWSRNLPNQVSDPWNSRKQQAAFLKQVSLCTACIKLKLYRSKFTKWRKPKHLAAGPVQPCKHSVGAGCYCWCPFYSCVIRSILCESPFWERIKLTGHHNCHFCI